MPQDDRFVTPESDTDVFGSGWVKVPSAGRETEPWQAGWPLKLDWLRATVGEGEGDLSALTHSKVTKIKSVFMNSWKRLIS